MAHCVCCGTDNVAVGLSIHKTEQTYIRTITDPRRVYFCAPCYYKIRDVRKHLKYATCNCCGGIFERKNLMSKENYFEIFSMSGFSDGQTEEIRDRIFQGVTKICCACFYDRFCGYLRDILPRTNECTECGVSARKLILQQTNNYTVFPWYMVTLEVEQQFISLGDYTLCPTCYPNWDKCTFCGRVARKENIFNAYGCCNCIRDIDDVVRAHNYKPKVYQHYHTSTIMENDIYKVDTTRYFGTELEFHVGEHRDRNTVAGLIEREMYRLLGKKHNLYYYKHDGSVKPGFEIVTMPMTREFIDWRQDIFAMLFSTMKSIVPTIDALVENHPSCGFHVHVSRDSMSKLHVFRLASFVFSNVDNLSRIGRRPLNQYCNAKIRYPLTMQSNKALKLHDERYKVLNLQNEETIEFRFPKGLTDIETFLMTLELCDSLVGYTQNISNSDTAFSKYFEYVVNNKREFPRLLDFMCSLDSVMKFKDFPQHPDAMRKKTSHNGFFDWLRMPPLNYNDIPVEPDDDNYEFDEDDDLLD